MLMIKAKQCIYQNTHTHLLWSIPLKNRLTIINPVTVSSVSIFELGQYFSYLFSLYYIIRSGHHSVKILLYFLL